MILRFAITSRVFFFDASQIIVRKKYIFYGSFIIRSVFYKPGRILTKKNTFCRIFLGVVNFISKNSVCLVMLPTAVMLPPGNARFLDLLTCLITNKAQSCKFC